MVWTDGAAGIPLSQELLDQLTAQIPGAERLDMAEALGALPGIEYGTERELGAFLLPVLREKGLELSQRQREELERGWTVLCALGQLVLARTARLLRYADLAAAMNLEAIRGELGAFDDRLHRLARPYPGQIDCAENIRRLTAGSEMTCDKGRFAFGYDKAPRVQDAICVRATPQTHGGVRDVFSFAQRQLRADMSEGEATMARAELALSALLTALADLAHISERRAFRLNDTHLSYGLPMNLVVGDVGINHGFPVVQSTQAALVAELKLLLLPAPLLRVGEESTAYLSLCKTLKAIELAERVLAVEILMAAQGMDIVSSALPQFSFGGGTSAAHRCLRSRVAVLTENRFMVPDMAAALELLQNGVILSAAEDAVGALR
ncbi:MIO-dependent tyrosine 2,3-aminomutase [Firmicutes bacterium ASF500]|nr:MIO-dependent tyrosine 2,3-aminomutase [Firmicutes bacterium ASF500]